VRAEYLQINSAVHKVKVPQRVQTVSSGGARVTISVRQRQKKNHFPKPPHSVYLISLPAIETLFRAAAW